MKMLLVIVAALALNSCNTLIGLGRDTKQGYQWTKSKFEDKRSEPDDGGAPVY